MSVECALKDLFDWTAGREERLNHLLADVFVQEPAVYFNLLKSQDEEQIASQTIEMFLVRNTSIKGEAFRLVSEYLETDQQPLTLERFQACFRADKEISFSNIEDSPPKPNDQSQEERLSAIRQAFDILATDLKGLESRRHALYNTPGFSLMGLFNALSAQTDRITLSSLQTYLRQANPEISDIQTYSKRVLNFLTNQNRGECTIKGFRLRICPTILGYSNILDKPDFELPNRGFTSEIRNEAFSSAEKTSKGHSEPSFRMVDETPSSNKQLPDLAKRLDSDFNAVRDFEKDLHTPTRKRRDHETEMEYRGVERNYEPRQSSPRKVRNPEAENLRNLDFVDYPFDSTGKKTKSDNNYETPQDGKTRLDSYHLGLTPRKEKVEREFDRTRDISRNLHFSGDSEIYRKESAEKVVSPSRLHNREDEMDGELRLRHTLERGTGLKSNVRTPGYWQSSSQGRVKALEKTQDSTGEKMFSTNRDLDRWEVRRRDVSRGRTLRLVERHTVFEEIIYQ